MDRVRFLMMCARTAQGPNLTHSVQLSILHLFHGYLWPINRGKLLTTLLSIVKGQSAFPAWSQRAESHLRPFFTWRVFPSRTLFLTLCSSRFRANLFRPPLDPIQPFFSPSPAPTPFFFFAFAFLPLRSLFFNPPIPTLQTSAYFTKNPSSSSACTTVDSLTLSFRFSFDFPSVARIKTGRGCGGWRSGKGEEGGRGMSVADAGRPCGDTIVQCQ